MTVLGWWCQTIDTTQEPRRCPQNWCQGPQAHHLWPGKTCRHIQWACLLYLRLNTIASTPWMTDCDWQLLLFLSCGWCVHVILITNAIVEPERKGFTKVNTFTITDIRSLPARSIPVTYSCSGNRRGEVSDRQAAFLAYLRGGYSIRTMTHGWYLALTRQDQSLCCW